MNGQFTIYTKADDGNAGFKVEEYKRPKFYVEYEPIKGTYKVNDKIKVTGIAKAYAGNNIDGATVKYRVVRQPRFHLSLVVLAMVATTSRTNGNSTWRSENG